jgi:hypothetical protein
MTCLESGAAHSQLFPIQNDQCVGAVDHETAAGAIERDSELGLLGVAPSAALLDLLVVDPGRVVGRVPVDVEKSILARHRRIRSRLWLLCGRGRWRRFSGQNQKQARRHFGNHRMDLNRVFADVIPAP